MSGLALLAGAGRVVAVVVVPTWRSAPLLAAALVSAFPPCCCLPFLPVSPPGAEADGGTSARCSRAAMSVGKVQERNGDRCRAVAHGCGGASGCATCTARPPYKRDRYKSRFAISSKNVRCSLFENPIFSLKVWRFVMHYYVQLVMSPTVLACSTLCS